MISVEKLSKKYGGFTALRGISFSAQQGEILALLGPNGAGKTTTMKIITSFITASSGFVKINGEKASTKTQKYIGYLPENTPLYPDLTVYEHLDFSAQVHEIQGDEKVSAINAVIKSCGLAEKLHFSVSELSKGYKQRLGLAQALIHNPDILILDEPTTGLDPNQILEIRELIKKLGKKKTIILSTHIMQEVEAIADRVILINKGEIVAEGSPETLMKGKTTAEYTFKVVVEGVQKNVLSLLKSVPEVLKVHVGELVEKGVYSYFVSADSDVRKALNKAIIKADFELIEISEETQTMEDVFHELTKK